MLLRDPELPPVRTRTMETILAQLPDLTGQVTTNSKFASAHGGFASVWRGVWDVGHVKHTVCQQTFKFRMSATCGLVRVIFIDRAVQVAIKVLRSYSETSEDETRKLNKVCNRLYGVWTRIHDQRLITPASTTRIECVGRAESQAHPSSVWGNI